MHDANRAVFWKIAADLQGVDNLEVSAAAAAAAYRYIDGEIGCDQVVGEVEALHRSGYGRQREADIAAARICAALDRASSSAPDPSIRGLRALHAELFRGALDHPAWETGWRTESISKPEKVLGGRSVVYFPPTGILNGLEYDFAREAEYRYAGHSAEQVARHHADFVAGIWQIHPFREGNTRTMAVFSLALLARMGVPPERWDTGLWGRWYRDALVRATYYGRPRNGEDEIPSDQGYLYAFYENVVCGAGHDLGAMDLTVPAASGFPDGIR